MSDRVCEVVMCWQPLTYCGQSAAWRYPALGGGYMHLCEAHAAKHLDSAEAIGMTAVANAQVEGSQS